MKKTDGHPTLFGYAGRYKYLTYAALLLSGISALLSLAPFLCIRNIVRGVIGALPASPDTSALIANG